MQFEIFWKGLVRLFLKTFWTDLVPTRTNVVSILNEGCVELDPEDFRVLELSLILEFDKYVASEIEKFLFIVPQPKSDLVIFLTVLNFWLETEHFCLLSPLTLVNLKVRLATAGRNIWYAKELNSN